MPGFNQTGPGGRGPGTGRKKGRCTNYGASLGNQNDSTPDDKGGEQSVNLPGKGPGRGMGRAGRGRGPGRKNRSRS